MKRILLSLLLAVTVLQPMRVAIFLDDVGQVVPPIAAQLSVLRASTRVTRSENVWQ